MSDGQLFDSRRQSEAVRRPVGQSIGRSNCQPLEIAAEEIPRLGRLPTRRCLTWA